MATISVAHLYNLRKRTGYQRRRQHWTKTRAVNIVIGEQLNAYVNFHRPCLFAETITDAKGRQRKRYPCKLMMTPDEKLKSPHQAQPFLKPRITFEQLDAQATAISDNDAARRLNQARATLFKIRG